MREIDLRTERRIHATTDLAGAPALALALAPTGAGTFGEWVERHYLAASVLGMVASGAVITSEMVTMGVLLGGPLLAATGLAAAVWYDQRQRLRAADMAVSMAALSGLWTLLAVSLGGSLPF